MRKEQVEGRGQGPPAPDVRPVDLLAGLWWAAWRWLPLLLWMAAIFFVSNQPTTTIPSFGLWDLLVKKAAHMVAYAVLFVLAQRATGRLPVALLVTMLYAVTDEYHQTFIPGRHGNATDVLIDGIGAILAAAAWRFWPLRE